MDPYYLFISVRQSYFVRYGIFKNISQKFFKLQIRKEKQLKYTLTLIESFPFVASSPFSGGVCVFVPFGVKLSGGSRADRGCRIGIGEGVLGRPLPTVPPFTNRVLTVGMVDVTGTVVTEEALKVEEVVVLKSIMFCSGGRPPIGVVGRNSGFPVDCIPLLMAGTVLRLCIGAPKIIIIKVGLANCCQQFLS